MRQDRGRLVATLAATFNDFTLAEDALQDALFIALEKWGNGRVPENPAAWLYQVAKRRALDVVRRSKNLNSKIPDIQIVMDEREQSEEYEVGDHRLRLMYTCCHPALDPEVQIALTLYTVGGLRIPEIAKAFLVKTPTMAARITRAKHKIQKACIPFALPDEAERTERLVVILQVIYLIYNEGYAATEGQNQLRLDLCEEALFLARMVLELSPNEPEVIGLIALIQFSHARRAARSGAQKQYLPMAEQDRALWDHEMIRDAHNLLTKAMQQARIGPYQVQAAIHGLHCDTKAGEAPDWPQISGLYSVLLRLEDSPVVRLNYAVAVSFAQSPEIALGIIAPVAAELEFYQPYYVALADISRRAGQMNKAITAYDRAIEFSGVTGEKEFLLEQRQRCYVS